MDSIDILALTANIIDDYCVLNHGPGTETQKAVDFLTQPMGKTSGELKEEDLSHITIPICKDCVEGLLDNDWLLLYCLDCHSNQWLNRSKAKLSYGLYDIIWFKGCPKCAEKPTAVYFD